jgi:flagellar hook-associated protein 1 FlgK
MGGGELPFTVQNGSFDVVVYDSTGSIVETITVPITPAATLGTIEGAISASPYMNVAIGAGGLMTVSPETGYSFTFANDSSNVLTALGLNGLFTGTGAASIAVNRTLQENPSLLSSGYSLDMRDTGDNRAALAMAELRSRQFFGNGVQTINEFYESGVVQLGVNSRSNQDRLAVEQAFVLDFDRRRQEVSGVNLDEEVTSLLIYQRAFEASARVVGVANSMLETLVNLVR